MTRRIAVIDWPTYSDKVLSNGAIDVGELLSNAEARWTLTEDPGSDEFTFSPDQPGYYVVVVFSDANTFNDELVFKVTSAVAGKPSVSISVDKTSVAIGDYIKVSASMNTDVPVKNYQNLCYS